MLPSLICCLLVSAAAFSQKTDTIRGEEATALLRQINQQLGIDSAKLFRGAQQDACMCIDSISVNGKSRNDIVEEINGCITKHSTLLQGTFQIFKSMMGESKSNEIKIDVDKDSPEFQRYYRKLETWLRDSCTALDNAVGAHNEESKKSFSENPRARKEYNEGVEWLKKNDYEKALKNFENAVKIDSEFAFAWDNIGICNRRLGNLEEALKAYRKSLEIDPNGITPLHNIPVVYEFQKKYDKAIDAYEQLGKKHPFDPEAYYGAGRMYLAKNEMEKALDKMCRAYNLYVEAGSPYRVDAEKNINYIYSVMKKDGKEKRFFEILSEHKLSPSKE